MKVEREKAILEALRYAFEVKLPRHKSVKSRVKIWEKLKKYLFWDDPEAHLDRLEDLNTIQKALQNFFVEYFFPALNGWDSKELPEPNFKRWFFCKDGHFRYVEKYNPEKVVSFIDKETDFRYSEVFYSRSDEAVQRVIRLLAMPPALPLTKFFRCDLDDCKRWAINNRKKRKHWFCSKRCYDVYKKREVRSK